MTTPSSTSRVLSHLGRNAKRYSIGAGATAAAGATAPAVGRRAGGRSIDQKDPHYNTNYRAGRATFVDRDRKIKKSLGESLREAIGKAAGLRVAEKVKGAVTPERVAAGTAAGVGLTYVGSKAVGGVKQGRQDKRKQGMTHGYEDAWRNRREESDGWVPHKKAGFTPMATKGMSAAQFKAADQRGDFRKHPKWGQSYETKVQRSRNPFKRDQVMFRPTGTQREEALQEIGRSFGAVRRFARSHKPELAGTGVALAATTPFAIKKQRENNRARREALDASDFGYINKDTPARKRREEDPFSEDVKAGVQNKVGQAIEFRKQHKVKGVGGDAAVDAITKVKESELTEVGGYIRAGKAAATAAATAAKATRAGRVAGKAVPWTSRGLIATDIAVLGGGAAKAGHTAATKKSSEQKEGARLSRAGALAGKSVQRGDPLIFGTGTALGLKAKGRDLSDDQKLNQSHIRNRKESDDSLTEARFPRGFNRGQRKQMRSMRTKHLDQRATETKGARNMSVRSSQQAIAKAKRRPMNITRSMPY